jgi:hypothetical protein
MSELCRKSDFREDNLVLDGYLLRFSLSDSYDLIRASRDELENLTSVAPFLLLFYLLLFNVAFYRCFPEKIKNSRRLEVGDFLECLIRRATFVRIQVISLLKWGQAVSKLVRTTTRYAAKATFIANYILNDTATLSNFFLLGGDRVV